MPDLSLAWRLARRELRGGLAGFRVFIACLALGVAAIAAVGWTGAALVGGLSADARKLLGGDIEVRLIHRTATPQQLDYLRDNSTGLSSTVNMRSMAIATADDGGRTLVQLKAVDDAYPLVGEVETDPTRPLGDVFAVSDGLPGALIDPGLLGKLNVAVGDTVRIGIATFRIAGVIDYEPDRVTNAINFGPRFMISNRDLEATGLVQPGSLIRYYYKVTLAPGTDVAAWRQDLEQQFPDAGWRVRATDQAAPGVRRFVDRMTLFMSFVGYTVLLVGGVGITRAVTAYLESKTRTIASLKCLGAEAGLIVAIYMLQVLILGLVGITIGLVAGIALPAMSLGALAAELPVRPEIAFYPTPVLIAAAFGIMITITAALWPLGRAREVPARDLFRAGAQPLQASPRSLYLVWLVLGALGLIALVLLTASNMQFAIWFIIGAALTFALLRVIGAVLITLSRRVHPKNAMLRLVLANVHRPGTAAPGIILSLGLGLSVLVAVVQIEGNISNQISDRLPDQAPAYFFLDIQPHQVEAFDNLVNSTEGTAGLRREPMIRGRIIEIDGQPADQVEVDPGSRWALRGDRGLTALGPMPDGTEIVSGAWWPADYSGPPLLSFDADLAAGFGVGLGDTLTVNVLGREFTAEIASLRRIDWGSLQFNTAIILSPGILAGAPVTHVAAVQATGAAEDTLERVVTDAFPNVSAIKIRDALQAVAELMQGIGVVVQAVGLLTVVAGAVVLAGALAAGQRRRTFDAVVFKVLGATRKRIAMLFLLEYGALGLLTAIAAVGVGSLTSWAVIGFLMDMDWIWLPGQAAATVLLALFATIGFGLAGSWRTLGLKTAPYLRND